MEYYALDGSKVIVEGNRVDYGDGKFRKNIIGPNYIDGSHISRTLSSFNDAFTDETINIGSGIDVINTEAGNFEEAYLLLKEKLIGKDRIDIYELSQIVLETVDEYFGGIQNIDSRMNYYHDIEDENNRDNKISNLKGTGAAMCVERSVLSQNLLKSLGINSTYKSSGIIKNGEFEVHSYNLIENNNSYYIFDSSIPNYINGQPNPLISEIDKETYDLISCPLSDIGISTTVSHYNPYRDIDVTITYDSGRDKSIEVDSLMNSSKHINK